MAISGRIRDAPEIEENDLLEIVPEFVRKEIETSLTCHGIDGVINCCTRPERQGIACSRLGVL